jgi:hypothetical protein
MSTPCITAEERDQFALDDELDGKAIARAAEWDDPTDCD